MDVDKSILPTGSGRGELKKTSLFCPFSLKNPLFSPLFSCFNSCRPHQNIQAFARIYAKACFFMLLYV